MAEWQHWSGWRRTCALAACDADTQAALKQFALSRWRRFSSVCAERMCPASSPWSPPGADEAWHDFESSVCLRNTRRGKAYKNWLFARAPAGAAVLDIVQGGATLILRDVVRERFRREMPRANELSLDAPPPGCSADAPTLLELLPSAPSPGSDVQQRELRTLGAEVASALAAHGLSRRQKIALLARDAGCSLSNSSVLTAAGCGKSVLCTAYHAALRAVARTVNERFTREDRMTRANLAVAAFESLPGKLHAWARSEKRLPRFLYEGAAGGTRDALT